MNSIDEGRVLIPSPDVPEEPLHDCTQYGSVPVGYARFTRAGMCFHDPRDCPRWLSQETMSFNLSEDESDVDNIHAIGVGPSV